MTHNTPASEVYDWDGAEKQDWPTCNCCGWEKPYYSAMKDRAGYDVQLAICVQCGLRWLTPYLTDEAAKDFYDSGAYRAVTMTRKSERAKRLYKNPALIADVHRGYGASVASWILRCVRQRPTSVAHIGTDAGKEDHVGWAMGNVFGVAVESVPWWQEMPYAQTYDLIACCRAIDHFTDIREFLQEMRERLTATGTLFMDILNTQYLHMPKIDHPYMLTHDVMLTYLHTTGYRLLASSHNLDKGGHIAYLATPF